jgi:hypothetical protein
MRRRTLVVGVILLAGAGLVLFCCGGSERRASDATGASPTASVDAPPAAPAVSEAAPLPSAAHPSAPTASSSGGATGTTSSSAGARIAQAVSGSDPRDLELLASIERELHRDPPPEVHALVAERKRGATREELARAVQRLPDLELRVLAQRWLDKVAPR